MASVIAALAAGGAMGLASALHCGAMCSGVCGAALMILQPGDGRQRVVNLGLLHAGRIAVYATLGGIGAAAGSALITAEVAAQYRAMQWAAAIAMMAMGLAMAGFMPRVAGIDRSYAVVTGALTRLAEPLKRWPSAAPFSLGVMWGGNACPMVYGAVLTAMLTGSVVNGVAFMSAFGIGTLPALVVTGYGVSKLKALSSRAAAQTAGGLALAGAGLASLYAPAMLTSLHFSRIFCVTP